MEYPLAEQLKVAREARGLTLEDAAHATRIPVPRLRQLEEGNYAAFGNMAYARSFVRLYSRYLEVDAESFVTGLPEPVLGGASDYRYLTETYGPWVDERNPRSPRRGDRPVNLRDSMPSPVIYAFLIVCFVGIGSAIFARTYLLPKAAAAAEEASAHKPVPPAQPQVQPAQPSNEPVLAVSKVSRAPDVPVNLDKVPVRRAIPVVEEYGIPADATANKP